MYERRIGNRTQAFEWYQFEWPSMTYDPDFKVTIIQRQITRKWYKIALYLQWPSNRKSYMIYRTAPFSTTLNGLPRFQGHAIFWRWISQKRYDITEIISMKYYYGLTHVLLNSVISNDLEWLSKIFNDTKRRAVSVRQLSFLISLSLSSSACRLKLHKQWRHARTFTK